MITINNRLLISTDFWKSMKEIMTDKSLDVEIKMRLAGIKRELANKVDDLQSTLEGLDDARKMVLFKVDSTIDSKKVTLSHDDVDGFSAEDLYNLNDIIILED